MKQIGTNKIKDEKEKERRKHDRGFVRTGRGMYKKGSGTAAMPAMEREFRGGH